MTRAIEEAFRRKEIPHVIYSGVRFYDRAEIKDALSYLRLIAYRDDLSFLRVANTPKRNLGERRIAFLKQVAEERGVSLYRALELSVDQELFKGTRARALLKLVETFSATAGSRPVSDLLGAVLDESGYERMLRTEGAQNRLDNLAELKQAIYEYETTCGEEVTLEAYLSRVALLTNKDTAEAGDRVKLMTIHAAKGLEFPTVFLCALNAGMMPSKKTDSQAAMEEERRLAFVAMTRAEKRLYLSASGGRDFDGAPRFPSRFILDVGRERLACSIPISDEMAKSLGDYVRQSDARFKDAPPTATPPRFAPGDRIRHPVFGTGSVLSVDTVKATCRIRFDALPTPRELALSARMEQLGRDGA